MFSCFPIPLIVFDLTQFRLLTLVDVVFELRLKTALTNEAKVLQNFIIN